MLPGGVVPQTRDSTTGYGAGKPPACSGAEPAPATTDGRSRARKSVAFYPRRPRPHGRGYEPGAVAGPATATTIPSFPNVPSAGVWELGTCLSAQFYCAARVSPQSPNYPAFAARKDVVEIITQKR